MIDKKYLLSKVRTIPNWPKQGIMFRDITTLIKDFKAFEMSIQDFVERYKSHKIDYIVGVESRGFIIGAAVAHLLGVGFIPVRKKGKLPADTISVEYELEYGNATLEIHSDALKKGERVVIMDDLLATGGTMIAASHLVEKLGATVYECAFIINLPELHGEEKLHKAGLKTYCQIEFEGE